jgi:hypothetical protein
MRKTLSPHLRLGWEARQDMSYIMTEFPEAMRNITAGRSLVKCNFEVG